MYNTKTKLKKTISSQEYLQNPSKYYINEMYIGWSSDKYPLNIQAHPRSSYQNTCNEAVDSKICGNYFSKLIPQILSEEGTKQCHSNIQFYKTLLKLAIY